MSKDVRCNSPRMSFVLINPSFSSDFRNEVSVLKEECLISTGVVASSVLLKDEGMYAGRDGRRWDV